MSLYIYVNIKETYKHDILWHFKFAIIVMFQIPFDPANQYILVISACVNIVQLKAQPKFVLRATRKVQEPMIIKVRVTSIT